ncbi:delta-like protein 1 [Lethenteron reissneri]|uniref:delta-like protein 1 n=1 Tax=Lethenteron reissneri TaxID=7753 RepID=UPI002AB7CBD6|nr:delta-like protein 1 [Lethenteron reissneri]
MTEAALPNRGSAERVRVMDVFPEAALRLWIVSFVIFPVLLLQQAACAGIFELKLQEFTNDQGLLLDGASCGASAECRTFFSVCLKHYQASIMPEPPCTYGSVVTPVLGLNSFAVRDSDRFQNPIRFPFSFTWPGTFSLIIDAWHAEADGDLSTDDPARLISRLATQRHLSAGDDWSQDTHASRHAALRYSYRVVCAEHYYGESCSAICRARDDAFGHFTCGDTGQKVCLPGWRGPYCAEAMCLPGCSGICDKPGECKCRVGWQGRYCDDCIRYPGCLHGTCQQPWQCTCREGWGGLFCNQDLNYCTNHRPCQNGATCTNSGQGSYSCTCQPGYSGTNCEFSVNECDVNPCRNGGSCTDLENDYSCVCPSGFFGKNCDMSSMTCDDTPCFNGGRCADDAEGGGYSCHCPSGFSGFNCEKKAEHCSSNPCANGAQCLDLGATFKCRCKAGFTGNRCEMNVDDCGRQPCLHGGTCRDLVNGFTCSCPTGYEGKDCGIPVSYCQSGPCFNGGVCVLQSGDGGYACECRVGFGGIDCSELVLTRTNTAISNVPSNFKRHEGSEEAFPWLAVGTGLGMVLLLLAGTILLLVCRRLKQNQSGQIETADGNNGMNNRNDCEREKELAVNLLTGVELKNTNKQMDVEPEGCLLKSGYRLKYQDMDYNMILEKAAEAGEDHTSADKCQEANEKHQSSGEASSPSEASYTSVYISCPEQAEQIVATEV